MAGIRNCLIVGGGVGGLTAAIAFAQRDVGVTLIEKRPNFDAPGVGLGQPACALRVYRQLGVLEKTLDHGFHYGHMDVFDSDRKLIAHHEFQMGDEHLPAFCALPRADLHQILHTRAQHLGVDIRMETTTKEIAVRPDRAEVVFADGSQADFDLVAGFDGIRSSVRNWLVGDMFDPRPSGFGAWRVQADRPTCVTGMEFMQGIGGKTGAIPIGPDRMYLFNIRPENPAEYFPADEMHELLRARLAQFGSYVREIAESLTFDSNIVYGGLEPFLLPVPWHRGRVTLGGDAAHVVPPHLTAGAAMAVEDGWILSRKILDGEGSVEDRLTAYGRERFARNAFVYSFARDWIEAEQSVTDAVRMETARAEMVRNTSRRISVADRFLETYSL